MATSSSSSSHCPRIKYDVFLSFRGADVRFGFLGHLEKALRQKGIDAYIDDRLERGDEISSALLRAIEESLMSLIIFSEDYASSRWCLEELVKIIECMKKYGQIVLPVFYNIDPSDVRHQKGTYKEAFDRHELRFKDDMVKVQDWRVALKKAANLSGFHSYNFGTEADLIEEIVEHILLRMNHIYQSDLNGLVGIHGQIAYLESILSDGSEDVCVFGIWGMGGIGKTTIASALYNKLCFEYEGCCFLANVREESQRWGVAHLHNRLLSILLKEKDLYIAMPCVGSAYIMRRLSRRKVLVVLDDVDNYEQLRILAGERNWFGPGSRIIVTTRNKHLLSKDVDYIYEVQPLFFDDALQLFNLNAFNQNSSELEYMELSMRVVSYAKGIPLALKVLGSFLYGKSKEEWESQLEKLRKMPYMEVQNALRLSYDGLDREERNIFLYIACFFKGEEEERIKLMLDACGYSTTIALRNLQDKALIFVSDSYVKMHDLIQEMGLEIVREESIEDPGRRSRLWDSKDIYKVLKNKSGTKAIQSIIVDTSSIEELQLCPQSFARMSKLKFLKFYTHFLVDRPSRVYLPGSLESLPNDLKLLHWDEYPLKSLPSKFCAENLVELRMQFSRVEKLWEGAQNFVNLKEVNLRWSEQLIELSDFSKALNLESVDLQGCTKLRRVHSSIFSLHKLAKLHLEYCNELSSLKSEDCLRSLEELDVRGCSSLKEFSIRSEKMTRLFLGSTPIDDLPSLVSHLNKLEWLDAPFSESLENLPNNFLERLNLNNCGQLDTSSLFARDALRSLKQLQLDDKLSKLPDNINLLSSLQGLSLGTSDVESLPASIKHLSQLRSLDLFLCRRLQSIPELPPSIAFLDARYCESLETVSSSTAELSMKQHRSCFLFQNCLKLDEHALNTIMTDAYIRINRAANEYSCPTTTSTEDEDAGLNDIIHISFHFPKYKVPDWFTHWTSQDSIIIKFPPNSGFVAFIFCLVLPQFNPVAMDCIEQIGCQCSMKVGDVRKVLFESVFKNDDDDWYQISETQLDSDHMYLWYDEDYCLEINNGARERKADYYQCTTNNVEVKFEFFVQTRLGKLDVMIKESGVCPIYESDNLRFDEQGSTKMKICEEVDELDACINDIEDGCCGEKTKEPKPLFPMQKSIFPPLPTGTWKYSERKGLKELMFLVDTFSS